MKLISWNVNGLRAILKKGFSDFLKFNQPDILCLQETKISAATLSELNLEFSGYNFFGYSALRPGYSGTAVLVKTELVDCIKITNGFNLVEFDSEGRVQTVELRDFYLLNVYFPNANAQLSRLPYRLKFNEALLQYIKKLEKIKPVILTGDYNVAHQEIDLARPKENIGQAGFTFEEREWLSRFLAVGFLDTFRTLNGAQIQYSWWSFRAGARVRNVGWRIDYFCASAKLRNMLKKASILDKVTGSDHAPVVLEL